MLEVNEEGAGKAYNNLVNVLHSKLYLGGT